MFLIGFRLVATCCHCLAYADAKSTREQTAADSCISTDSKPGLHLELLEHVMWHQDQTQHVLFKAISWGVPPPTLVESQGKTVEGPSFAAGCSEEWMSELLKSRAIEVGRCLGGLIASRN